MPKRILQGVVVSDKGGPHELMVDGVTGFKVAGRDAASLCEAMTKLMDGPTRGRMGRSAREFVEENRVDEPFSAILDAEEYRQRQKRSKKVLALAEFEPGHEDVVEPELVDHRVLPKRAAGA